MTLAPLKRAGPVFWRRLRRALQRPATALQFVVKLWTIIRTGRTISVVRRYTGGENLDRDYARWVKLYDTAFRANGKPAQVPLFSIFMVPAEEDVPGVRLTIQSLIRQIYPHWELLIVSATASPADLLSSISEGCPQDERIKIFAVEPLATLSVRLNEQLSEANGDFILMVNPYDKVADHALYCIAVELGNTPAADIIYSDEDRLDENGQRCRPNFKPDWNPLLLLSQNYLGRLVAYRRVRIHQVGGFKELPLDMLEWDLALRVTEVCEFAGVKHIPRILCHVGQASLGDPKITNQEAVQKVRKRMLNGHFSRTGRKVNLSGLKDGRIRVNYCLPSPAPLVSIIIPTRDNLPFLSKCIHSILEKTTYASYELIIVDNQSRDAKTLAYLVELEAQGKARVLRYDAPFNYSAINNFAVQHAKGSLIALVNDDIEVISSDWLEEMAGYAIQEEVGAVGAMLYYPDDTIQHAGTILGLHGIAGHIFPGQPRGYPGRQGRCLVPQNLAAVTAACMLLRRTVYGEAGGLDEQLPVAFNDIDLCLRLMQKGYRNVWTPYAEFYHHESASRGYDDTRARQARAQVETALMHRRWGTRLGGDPAYNPNLSLESDFALAFPPRTPLDPGG